MRDLVSACIDPTYFIHKALYATVREFALRMRGRVLDVGCGSVPYKKYFAHAEYVGMEYDSLAGRTLKGPNVFYDGIRFPFKDGEFDCVLSTEVLEHVFNPDEFLNEIHRVLKPGGLLFLTTPLLWKEHQQPYDYGRYTSFGLKHLMIKHNFDIQDQRKLVTGICAISTLWTRYLKECITVDNYYLRIFLFALLISPWTILAIVASKLLPDLESTYIGNAVFAKKR